MWLAGDNRAKNLRSFFENINSVKAEEATKLSTAAVQKRKDFEQSVFDREKKRNEVCCSNGLIALMDSLHLEHLVCELRADQFTVLSLSTCRRRRPQKRRSARR